jgi:phosphoribosylformylglycinamidine synthase I
MRLMTRPTALILHAVGTNRDVDAARAVELAGGLPVIQHVNELRKRPEQLREFQMFILPGGFSYGDALGAGRLFSADLRWLFQDELARFVEARKPVIGICNGFQALVKSGWLPGAPSDLPPATLTYNISNRFECRWVWLEPNPSSPCVFTRGLEERVFCPVAHGEGRFVPRNDGVLADLQANGQLALTYVDARGGPAQYPANPNGSTADIAGICNTAGNILGLMPHPENHIFPWQHPRWMRGQRGNMGLAIFERGLRYASEL